jgi:hypothetical protein
MTLSSGTNQAVNRIEFLTNKAWGKISPKTTINKVLINPAIKPLNLFSKNSDVAETTATLVSNMAAKLRWLLRRSGSINFARKSPAFTLRSRSATFKDIKDMFKPEQMPDIIMKINTAITKCKSPINSV